MSKDSSYTTVLADFSEALTVASNEDNAFDIVHQTLVKLGFPAACYGYTDAPRDHEGRWKPLQMVTKNLPPGWDREWNQHEAEDPYYHMSYLQGEHEWQSIWENRKALSRTEICAMEYLADFGICRGITIPIRSARGFSVMSAIGDVDRIGNWRKHVERTKPLLRLIAHFFHNSSMSRLQSNPSTPKLSKRELECLYWGGCGKTSDEIATILDISPETVRIYYKRINQKLGTVNRSQAIAKAITLGLIVVN